MYPLSQEHLMIKKTMKEFVDNEIMPFANEWDERGEIPDSIIKKLAEQGVLGAPFSEKYGGAGLDYLGYILMVEGIARGCSSLRTTISVHTSLCSFTLNDFGTEEQKQKYLARLTKGEKLGAWALTEPDTGSDAAALKTRAEKDGSDYILNGNKALISNGDIADYVIIFAKTEPEKKHRGISAFLVEKGTPGFSPGAVYIKNKLGLHSSHTAELIMEDCAVPEENMIGAPGDGWRIAMHILNYGRLSVAAGAVGIAQACLDASRTYALQREAFGRPIGKFQLVQEMIADMATELEAGRLLVHKAAAMKDRGEDNTLAVSMAKLFTAKMAVRAADSAVQIHGGYGYFSEYTVERYYRDARICGLYEGTNQIQQLIIARKLLDMKSW